MRDLIRTGWLAIFVVLLAAGCATSTQEGAGGDVGEAEATTPPDTTAAGLWAHLEAEDYRNNWSLWPGKGALYTGQEPHGMLLTSYLNETAVVAIREGTAPLPEGSVIVKENYMPDSTLAAVTVMLKSSGYNAAHGDWYWLKRLADGTVEVQGRGAGCIACHQASPSDYIMTPPAVVEASE